MVAHAHASKLYSRKYRPSQGGKISITLNGDWAEPWDDTPESESALLCRLSRL
jgi:beta-glucosidase